MNLSISNKRLCGCPKNHLNCMTAKDWIRAQVGVWRVFYEKRDIRNRDVHPAVMPIALAKKCVELFTHRGELVLDPFSGVGTTLVACQDLERNALAFDINSKYCEVSKARLLQPNQQNRAEQIVICDDARNIPNHINNDSISLIFTSPPYANLLDRPRLNKSRRGDLRLNSQYLAVEQYSQDPRDLGTLAIEDYSAQIREIFSRLLPLLRPGGHSVINVPDIWWRDRKHDLRIPIHVHVYRALADVGYEFRNNFRISSGFLETSLDRFDQRHISDSDCSG